MLRIASQAMSPGLPPVLVKSVGALECAAQNLNARVQPTLSESAVTDGAMVAIPDRSERISGLPIEIGVTINAAYPAVFVLCVLILCIVSVQLASIFHRLRLGFDRQALRSD